MFDLRDAIYSTGLKLNHLASNTKKFFDSIVGKALVRSTASLGAEIIGIQLGQALPQLTLGSHIGEAIADRAVPTREIHQIEEEDRITISSLHSTKWKVIFVAASLAIGGGLNWVMAKMSDPENPFQGAMMGQFFLSTAGSIVGGMQAIRAFQDPIPEKYVQRTLQYLAGKGAVNFTRQLMPTPTRLAFVPWLIGSTAALTAGTAGYHAQNLTALYRFVKKGPHEIVKGAIDTFYPNLAKELSFQAPVFKKTIKALLSWGINDPRATHLVVRCFNDYAKTIQSNPKVLRALEEFRNSSRNSRIDLKAQAHFVKQIQKALPKNFKQRVLKPIVQSKIRKLADQIVEEIPNWETLLFGFPFTDQNDLFAKELRKTHLTLFLTHLTQRSTSLLSKKNKKALTRDEVQTFYSNAARLAIRGIYPEALPKSVQKATVEVIDTAIDTALPEEPSAPSSPSLLQRLANLIKKATSPIWETLKKIFSFSYKSNDAFTDFEVKRPRLARYYRRQNRFFR